MKRIVSAALLSCALFTATDALASPQEKQTSPSPAASAPTDQPPPPPGEIFDVELLDKPPQPREPRAAPKYPLEMKQRGITGQVMLRFVVGSDGKVYKLEVKSASHPEFVAPALKAVSAWKFKPGMKNGRPVNANLATPIVFSLSTR